MAATNATLT